MELNKQEQKVERRLLTLLEVRAQDFLHPSNTWNISKLSRESKMKKIHVKKAIENSDKIKQMLNVAIKKRDDALASTAKINSSNATTPNVETDTSLQTDSKEQDKSQSSKTQSQFAEDTIGNTDSEAVEQRDEANADIFKIDNEIKIDGVSNEDKFILENVAKETSPQPEIVEKENINTKEREAENSIQEPNQSKEQPQQKPREKNPLKFLWNTIRYNEQILKTTAIVVSFVLLLTSVSFLIGLLFDEIWLLSFAGALFGGLVESVFWLVLVFSICYFIWPKIKEKEQVKNIIKDVVESGAYQRSKKNMDDFLKSRKDEALLKRIRSAAKAAKKTNQERANLIKELKKKQEDREYKNGPQM